MGPTPNKEAMCTWYLLTKKKLVVFNGVSLGISTQNKPNGILVDVFSLSKPFFFLVLLIFCLYSVVCSLCFFFFLFVFLERERKKGYGVT